MRSCGDCTLCCKLVPVKELDKPANTRCVYQTRKGCSIYARRPISCALWSCGWLADQAATADLARPDRSHYVIDVLPDFVTCTDKDTGAPIKVPVIQIWIDPKHPDAHRDPALRAYLERQYEENGSIALVRYANKRAIVLFPPASTSSGWVERESDYCDAEHSRAEINAVMYDPFVQ